MYTLKCTPGSPFHISEYATVAKEKKMISVKLENYYYYCRCYIIILLLPV